MVRIDFTADIEACHSEAAIWGLDAKEFKLERWEGVTKEQKKAFLPFGAKPFICPAKPVFGPWLIHLLVGSLLHELQEDWGLDCEDEEVMEQFKSGRRLSGRRLSAERDAYGEVYLCSLRPCSRMTSSSRMKSSKTEKLLI